MFKVEAVVVGAGVVGLAIARALALRGVQVLLLEKEDRAGSGTSSRSSEVIHAGLYYEPSSLKAALCVPGGACFIAIATSAAYPTGNAASLSLPRNPARTPILAACCNARRRTASRTSRISAPRN